MTDLLIHTSIEPPTADLVLVGEVDHTATGSITSLACLHLLPREVSDVYLDLSRVTLLEPSVLDALLQIHNVAFRMGKRLVLRNPSNPAMRALTLAGLESQLCFRWA